MTKNVVNGNGEGMAPGTGVGRGRTTGLPLSAFFLLTGRKVMRESDRRVQERERKDLG